jgi:TonB family protein
MNGMGLMLDWTAKVTVIVVLALGAVALLRRQPAAVRHWVLAVALGCAAALPALLFVVPAWTLAGDWSPGHAAVTPGASADPSSSDDAAGVRRLPERDDAAASARSGSGFPLAESRIVGQWLVPLWFAGFALGCGVLLSGLVRLAWLAAHSRPVTEGGCLTLSTEMRQTLGLHRTVQLLETDHPALLFTWGLMRPKILLPRTARDWPDDLCRIVLAHEFAHIRRHDWSTQLLAELLRYACWFNPVIWLATTRLRQESEQSCDDAVIGSGVAGSDYAAQLLRLARAARTASPAWLPAPAMARPSSLERRIAAMLDHDVRRGSIPRATRAAIAGSLILLTMLLSGLAVFAQTFATLSGSVIDPTNRVLGNTTLLLTNAQTLAKYEVRSDSTGRFEFVGLPAGQYTLEAARPGFASLRMDLTISGQRLQKDLALQVGSLQETITVTPRRAPQPTGPSPRAVVPPPPPPPPPPSAPTARPPASHRAANCTPTAEGGNLVPPTKTFDKKPNYPDELVQAGVGGVVTLDARIQPEGRVGEVNVTTSADPALDAAAVEAIRQWQFTPTLLNCEAIEVKMAVHVTFRTQ